MDSQFFREKVEEITCEILTRIGEEFSLSFSTEGSMLLVNIESEKPGRIIGRGGRVLEDLQLLVYTIMRSTYPQEELPSFIIDAGGYRRAREEDIAAMAQDIAERVKRGGESILLEPMKAWERRVVHMAVRDDEAVDTESEDTEWGRSVRINPAPVQYVAISESEKEDRPQEENIQEEEVDKKEEDTPKEKKKRGLSWFFR